jgi:hypothetical protein
MIRMVALSVALSATAAAALPHAPTHPSLDGPGLTCADFRRNDDGSWSPTHTLLVGTVAMSPASHFQPGMKVFGSDLATTLNTKCLPPH